MTRPEQKPRDLWTDEEFIDRYGHIAQVRPYPVHLGKLKRPGWSAPIRTYLIWCQHCRSRPNKGFTVAHVAGHAGRLECGYCRRRYDQLLPSRFVLDTFLNPHRHPWFVAFLILCALVFALAAHR